MHVRTPPTAPLLSRQPKARRGRCVQCLGSALRSEAGEPAPLPRAAHPRPRPASAATDARGESAFQNFQICSDMLNLRVASTTTFTSTSALMSTSAGAVGAVADVTSVPGSELRRVSISRARLRFRLTSHAIATAATPAPTAPTTTAAVRRHQGLRHPPRLQMLDARPAAATAKRKRC